jgi:uncharacterized protein (DUF2147 family)
MKRPIVTIILLSFLGISAFSQSNSVVGYWFTEEGDSQVQIFQTSDGKYSGKVVWLRDDQDAKDDKNPNIKLQNRKVLGLQILSNFQYSDRTKEWVNGTIYDPNNGKTYDCFMWFVGNKDQLNIKGFIVGMRFLGRRTTWKRENSLRIPKSNNKQIPAK